MILKITTNYVWDKTPKCACLSPLRRRSAELREARWVINELFISIMKAFPKTHPHHAETRSVITPLDRGDFSLLVHTSLFQNYVN